MHAKLVGEDGGRIYTASKTMGVQDQRCQPPSSPHLTAPNAKEKPKGKMPLSRPAFAFQVTMFHLSLGLGLGLQLGLDLD